jgi:hypothetical protein
MWRDGIGHRLNDAIDLFLRKFGEDRLGQLRGASQGSGL